MNQMTGFPDQIVLRAYKRIECIIEDLGLNLSLRCLQLTVVFVCVVKSLILDF